MKHFSAHLPVRSTSHYRHNLTASQEDQRIKIQLHHKGLTVARGEERQRVEDFLTEVWSEFGRVSTTYYNSDFTSMVVTYKRREHAFFALAGLRDSIEVTVAIQTVVREASLLERAALAKQLFVCEKPGENILTASFMNQSKKSKKIMSKTKGKQVLISQ